MKKHINTSYSYCYQLYHFISIISMVTFGLHATHSLAAGTRVEATQNEPRILKKLGSRAVSKHEQRGLQKVPRLQVKLGSGDFESWGSEKVIYQPELLELGWGKPLSSDFATWKLATRPFPTNDILASGTVSNSGGEWGLFKVNLVGKIPSTPAAGKIQNYYIRVFPLSRIPSDKTLSPTSIVTIVYKQDNNSTKFPEDMGDYEMVDHEMVDHEVEVSLLNGGHGFDSHDLEARVDEWLCALTKISGPFRSAGESVRLYPNSKGTWVLSVKSRQQGAIKAKATCVRWGHFLLGDGRRAWGKNTQVGEFTLVAPDDSGFINGVPVLPSSCRGQNEIELWNGSTNFHPMCFISGMSGLFDSKDELVSIINRPEHKLTVERCEDGWSKGYAICADAGSTFYYPYLPAVAFQSVLGNNDNDYAEDLMKVDKGFCTLQEIRGKFDKFTFVELVRSSNGWWKLIGSPGNVTGEHRLQATVLCFHWSHPAHPTELP